MSTTQAQIAEAARRAGAGDLAGARGVCDDVLRREPGNLGATMLLGIIAASQGELDTAARNFERVLAAQPGRPDALFNLGLVRSRQDRQTDAIASFDQALRLDPSNAEAALGRADALLALSRWREAIVALDSLLQRHPNVATLWAKRGAAYEQLAEYGPALINFRRANALNPNDGAVLELLGINEHRAGRLRAAVDALSRAIGLGNDTADVRLQRGIVYQGLGQQEAAITDFARAHELVPSYRRVLTYYAEALHRAGRSDEVETMLERAQVHDPATAKIMLGSIRSDQRRDDEAIVALNDAIARDRDDYLAVWVRTLHNLRRGDLAAGFRDFDARLRGPVGEPGRLIGGIEWQPGTGQADRKLFVHPEQGFGDTIQFARYIPGLIDQGHEVVLQVPAPLVVLCRSLHPALKVIAQTEPIPSFDARVPLVSLPAKLGTTLETIPANVPYLRPTAEAMVKWQERIGALTQPRIGLSWSGRPTHERDAMRSIPFAKIEDVLAATGASFVSLQKDMRAEDAADAAREQRLSDFNADLTDFNQTAALIANLDLVISVDTSVAHLAGALGKPVWILLPAVPDWRWMWDRTDSPWYPSARLFRQTRYGDWSDVLERVNSELAVFIAQN